MGDISPILRYWALLQRNADGEFFLTVPDVPGFAGGGEPTAEGALAAAAPALRDHLELVVEHGGTLPEARSIGELLADPELSEDFRLSDATAYIAASLPRTKSRPVNITMDEALLNSVDHVAKARGLNRSELIAEAVQRMIAVSA